MSNSRNILKAMGFGALIGGVSTELTSMFVANKNADVHDYKVYVDSQIYDPKSEFYGCDLSGSRHVTCPSDPDKAKKLDEAARKYQNPNRMDYVNDIYPSEIIAPSVVGTILAAGIGGIVAYKKNRAAGHEVSDLNSVVAEDLSDFEDVKAEPSGWCPSFWSKAGTNAGADLSKRVVVSHEEITGSVESYKTFGKC